MVDLYNAVSLQFEVPCGGEDLAAIRGDIRLTRADGSEAFVPLGATQPDPPKPGEVIYRDDAGVLCRCWNWREAERTKLTPKTTAAFLCIEAVDAAGAEQVAQACDTLLGLVATHLGGHGEQTMLSERDVSKPFILTPKVLANSTRLGQPDLYEGFGEAGADVGTGVRGRESGSTLSTGC